MKTGTQIKRIVLSMVVIVMSTAGAGARLFNSDKLKLNVAMDKSVLLADTKQTCYVKVGVEGFAAECQSDRTAVNLAIVIDKSGSMGGEKIEKAKEAAIMVIQRLTSNDIVSVVLYDTEVNVLIPATKVSDAEQIIRRIKGIRADGSTALHAGVSKGGRELRKFIEKNRVNRMLLLSDGLANVGPQSPSELGQLGRRLIADGISVTTIGVGLGYNEDLMTQLAYKSDGSHYFAENACDLAKIFDKELGNALSVVAQEVHIEIECAEGIRPVRLLGRTGQIKGQKVSVFINQVYSEHEKYFILEVEVPGGKRKHSKRIVSVNAKYDNVKSGDTEAVSGRASVAFSNSAESVEKSVNRSVMVGVVELIATERNELATTLRDSGNINDAKKLLSDNADYLNSNAARYNSPKLKELGTDNYKDADNLSGPAWGRQRKVMRDRQSGSRTQR